MGPWGRLVRLTLILSLVLWPAASARAATLTATWYANSEEDLAGYNLYYGTASGSYTQMLTLPREAVSCQLTDLQPYTAYYAVMTAFDLSGNESGYSEEASASTICDQPVTYYRDRDGDGYGSPTEAVQACSQPKGYVTLDGDCNDRRRSIHPGAVERPDKVDNDCNGLIDDNLPPRPRWRKGQWGNSHSWGEVRRPWSRQSGQP